MRAGRASRYGRWMSAIIVAGGAVSWPDSSQGTSLLDLIRGSERLCFQVFRQGDGIGRHDIRFRSEDGRLIVEIDAEIRVKAFMFTLYSYEQRVREDWEDGRLVRLAAYTAEYGREYRVEGHASEAGFHVSGPSGSFVAPPDILLATYWHPGTARQTRLLDPKTGLVMKVSIDRVGTEPVATPEGAVESEKYEVRGGVHMTLWYDLKRRLTKAWFHTPEDGSVVEYRREPDRPGLQAAR